MRAFFDRFPVCGGESRVIGALCLLLLVWEGGARIFETRLSKDIAHLRALPQMAARMRESEAFRVLLVGNSLAREGIDEALLTSLLLETGRFPDGVEVEQMVPDGSTVGEWAPGYRRYFLENEATPDLLVVVTGRPHLLDGERSPEQLGAFFVGNGDLLRVLRSGTNFDESVRLLLGRCSVLFANRDRVRPLVGYHALPGYEAAWPLLAGGGVSRGHDSEIDAGTGKVAASATTQSLDWLIESADSGETPLLVVAIPMPEPYELPQSVKEALATNEVPVLNLSSLLGIGPEDFPDGYHLGAKGAEKVTEALAREVLLR